MSTLVVSKDVFPSRTVSRALHAERKAMYCDGPFSFFSAKVRAFFNRTYKFASENNDLYNEVQNSGGQTTNWALGQKD
jgi:hypothetical protein